MCGPAFSNKGGLMEGDDRLHLSEREDDDRSGSAGASTRMGKEWNRVARTPAFEDLMRRKKAFLVPAVIFFLVFYMSLPVLAGFTTLLDGPALGEMTWAYVFAFAQFPMVWILCHLYRNRANKWDGLIDRARREASEGRKTP